MPLLNQSTDSKDKFIPYESYRGPTPAASVFAAALTASGRNVFNLGQGAEKQTPSTLYKRAKEIYQLKDTAYLSARGMPTHDFQSPAYNPALSGGAANEKIAADFLNHMFGHNPSPSSTFVLNQQGRFGLGQAAILIKQYADEDSAEDILLPRARWPMLDGIFGRQHGYKLTDYGVQEGDLESSLDRIVSTFKEIPRIVYLNSPLNPTGRQTTPEEFKNILAYLEIFNEQTKPSDKTFLIIDDPYFHACEQRGADEQGARFKTFLDGQLNSSLHTPWIHILSGSKALGTAEKGFSIISCHASIATDMRKQLGENGGLAFSRYQMGVMMEAISPSLYPDFLDHCASIREKYFANFQSLTDYFNENVVAGNPSMTAVVAVDLNEIKGAKKSGLIGEWDIANQHDFIEYLGNEHQTVVVDNGFDENGNWLMRFAFAEKPTLCAEGIRRTNTAWNDLKSSLG